jgi:Zn-finger nucleic acid-binding protein
MTLVAGRDYFRCDYCTSFHFPNDTGDGIRVVGGPGALACPVCRHSLEDGRVENEPVHYCSHCRGFLATNATFGAIVLKRRAKRPAGESRHSFDEQELKRALDCPRCERRMDTHPYYGGGRVVVDTCPRCAIIWLDAGELAVIERHNPARPAPTPLPAAPPISTNYDPFADSPFWNVQLW